MIDLIRINMSLDKIRRLHVLSQHAGTEAEAALAAQRVRELLQKHNLDIGVLKLQQEEGKESACYIGRRSGHHMVLVHAVNLLCDVESFLSGSRNSWSVVFIGLPANVDTAVATFSYFLESVEALLVGYLRNQNPIHKFLGYRGRAANQAFRIGCSSRIFDRVHEQIEQERKKQTNDAMAVVKIGSDLAKRMMRDMKFTALYEPSLPWILIWSI